MHSNSSGIGCFMHVEKPYWQFTTMRCQPMSYTIEADFHKHLRDRRFSRFMGVAAPGIISALAWVIKQPLTLYWWANRRALRLPFTTSSHRGCSIGLGGIWGYGGMLAFSLALVRDYV